MCGKRRPNRSIERREELLGTCHVLAQSDAGYICVAYFQFLVVCRSSPIWCIVCNRNLRGPEEHLIRRFLFSECLVYTSPHWMASRRRCVCSSMRSVTESFSSLWISCWASRHRCWHSRIVAGRRKSLLSRTWWAIIEERSIPVRCWDKTCLSTFFSLCNFANFMT